jgi:hypothetical protein
MKKTNRILSLGLLAGVPLLAQAGDEIKVYRIPKEKPLEMAQAKMPAGHPEVAAARSEPALTWKTPEGWTEVKAGELRAASFTVKGSDGKQADVSVIPLSGMAGGDLANANRWRSQVGLAPVSADELKKLASNVELAGQPAELYDFGGKNPASGDSVRILAAVQHREGTAWFFKMTGDDGLVEKQRAAFEAFLKSVRFTAPQSTDALPPSHPPIENMSLPAGHPDLSAAPAPSEVAPESRDGQPKWSVPSAWKEVSGGQFLVAKFLIAGENGKQAAVNVSSSAGDGGGLAANVNRWRGQLGLTPGSEADIAKQAQKLETTGGAATLVELSGTDARSGQPTKLLAAILFRDGQSWFYKLMGDEKIVAAQADAFTKFVKEVKY